VLCGTMLGACGSCAEMQALRVELDHAHQVANESIELAQAAHCLAADLAGETETEHCRHERAIRIATTH
jgi:hypothetical protein